MEDFFVELSDEIIIEEECTREKGEPLSLEIEDTVEISDETIARGGNNIRMAFSESITITEELISAYKIKRVGDLAFARTNYP